MIISQEEYETRDEPRQRRVIAELRNVTKRFGSVTAATDLNLSIHEGEFISFLGPSGCGKTTALRMLAGFETPTEGQVLLDGVVVNDVDAHHRQVNMVFQHYALFPHLTVAQNIAYGLKQRRPRPPKAEIDEKVRRALELVRLPDFGPRRIWEMSGGQQQRVALARAIVNEPKVLLLDEPMAALDAKLRKEMQIELLTLQRELGITFILVTHDQGEALSMSDRICVMGEGRIQQVGTPQDLYDRPRNRYVAGFVGTSNFFEGTVLSCDGDQAQVELAEGSKIAARNLSGVAPGDWVTLSIRPEQISVRRQESAAGPHLPVRVENRIFLGEHTEYLLRHEQLGTFLALSPRQAELTEGAFDEGEAVFVNWDASAALALNPD